MSFQERVWTKVKYHEVRPEIIQLNSREKSYLIKRGVSEEMLSSIRRISDGYYLISTTDGIILSNQLVYFDIAIDGIDNLVEYAKFVDYALKTLTHSKSVYGLHWSYQYVKDNFDVDEDFVKLFKPNLWSLLD